MSIFEETLRTCAADVEAELQSRLAENDSDNAKKLTDAMRYSALDGGKRLRAFLTITCCAICGGERRNAVPYAAALEMMHAFSLIHDDLPCMDNDTLRRGKPTNHIAFGEATAMLAGDALSLKAIETAATNPYCLPEQNLHAVQVLSRDAGEVGMCGGQQIDLENEHSRISETVLEDLVNRKTGALFAASCALGAIAAGADENAIKKLRRFAYLTGLAFQIADDLLDLHASADELGKTPGKDSQSEKNTFPSLLGEEAARAYAAKLCAEAAELLQTFPDSPSREALLQYSSYILIRKK